MTENNMLTQAQERLSKAEKLITIARKTREDAIKAKAESETKLRMCEEELAKLGVTPDNAQAELDRIRSEIDADLTAIEDSIPIELLQSLRRI